MDWNRSPGMLAAGGERHSLHPGDRHLGRRSRGGVHQEGCLRLRSERSTGPSTRGGPSSFGRKNRTGAANADGAGTSRERGTLYFGCSRGERRGEGLEPEKQPDLFLSAVEIHAWFRGERDRKHSGGMVRASASEGYRASENQNHCLSR